MTILEEDKNIISKAILELLYNPVKECNDLDNETFFECVQILGNPIIQSGLIHIDESKQYVKLCKDKKLYNILLRELVNILTGKNLHSQTIFSMIKNKINKDISGYDVNSKLNKDFIQNITIEVIKQSLNYEVSTDQLKKSEEKELPDVKDHLSIDKVFDKMCKNFEKDEYIEQDSIDEKQNLLNEALTKIREVFNYMISSIKDLYDKFFKYRGTMLYIIVILIMIYMFNNTQKDNSFLDMFSEFMLVNYFPPFYLKVETGLPSHHLPKYIGSFVCICINFLTKLEVRQLNNFAYLIFIFVKSSSKTKIFNDINKSLSAFLSTELNEFLYHKTKNLDSMEFLNKCQVFDSNFDQMKKDAVSKGFITQEEVLQLNILTLSQYKFSKHEYFKNNDFLSGIKLIISDARSQFLTNTHEIDPFESYNIDNNFFEKNGPVDRFREYVLSTTEPNYEYHVEVHKLGMFNINLKDDSLDEFYNSVCRDKAIIKFIVEVAEKYLSIINLIFIVTFLYNYVLHLGIYNVIFNILLSTGVLGITKFAFIKIINISRVVIKYILSILPSQIIKEIYSTTLYKVFIETILDCVVTADGRILGIEYKEDDSPEKVLYKKVAKTKGSSTCLNCTFVNGNPELCTEYCGKTNRSLKLTSGESNIEFYVPHEINYWRPWKDYASEYSQVVENFINKCHNSGNKYDCYRNELAYFNDSLIEVRRKILQIMNQ